MIYRYTHGVTEVVTEKMYIQPKTRNAEICHAFGGVFGGLRYDWGGKERTMDRPQRRMFFPAGGDVIIQSG